MSTTSTAITQPDATALETLLDAVARAQQAYTATQVRIAEGGKLQRLAPGVWLVTREVPDAPEGGA